MQFVNRRLSCIIYVSILVLLVLPVAGIRAAHMQQPDPKANSAKIKRRTPYCGLYCLYFMMKMSGKDVDFRELLKPEYVSSSKGSTILELKKAAEDNGLYTKPVGRITIKDLCRSPYPVILHIKSNAGDEEYDHFELFLDSKTNKARMLNPPDSVKLIGLSDLAPRWGGNGLFVSTKPMEFEFLHRSRQKLMAAILGLGVVFILVVPFVKRRFIPASSIPLHRAMCLSARQAAGFTVLAFFCGFAHHFGSDMGLLANASATASVTQAHRGDFIRKVSEKKIHKLLDTDTVFVDARLAGDFEVEHFKGAINIPVNSNAKVRRTAMATIPKKSSIVVYCQSVQCKYAEKVAIGLMSDGFLDISIFRGGWHEWVTKNGNLMSTSKSGTNDAGEDNA